MAWAASHMAFVTGSSETQIIARHYRMLSMQGLQGAITLFGEKNADAVLAASLLLSWQAADPYAPYALFPSLGGALMLRIDSNGPP